MLTKQLIFLPLLFYLSVILTVETDAVPEDTYVVHTEKYNSRAISAISDAVAVFISNYLNKMCKGKRVMPKNRLPFKIAYPMRKKYPSQRIYGYDSYEPEESRRAIVDEPPNIIDDELIIQEYVTPKIPKPRIYNYNWQMGFGPEDHDTYKPQSINFYVRPGMANVISHRRLPPPMPTPHPEPQPHEFAFYNPWFIAREREDYEYMPPLREQQHIQSMVYPKLPPTPVPTISEHIVQTKVIPAYYTHEVKITPPNGVRKNLQNNNDDMEQRFNAMLIIIKEIRSKLNQKDNENIGDDYKTNILIFLNDLEQQIEQERNNPASDEEDKENLLEGNKRTVMYIQKIIDDLQEKQQQQQTTNIFVEHTTLSSRKLNQEEPSDKHEEENNAKELKSAEEVKPTAENISEETDINESLNIINESKEKPQSVDALIDALNSFEDTPESYKQTEENEESTQNSEEYDSSVSSYTSEESNEYDEKENATPREGNHVPMRKNLEESEPKIIHKQETQTLEATNIMDDTISTTTPTSHLGQERRANQEEPTKQEEENEENIITTTEFIGSKIKNNEETHIEDKKELENNDTEKPKVNDFAKLEETGINNIDDPKLTNIQEAENQNLEDHEDNNRKQLPINETEETEVKDIIEPEVNQIKEHEVNKIEDAVLREMEEPDVKKIDPELREMTESEVTEINRTEDPEFREMKEPEVTEMKEPEVTEIQTLEVTEIQTPEVKEVEEPKESEIKQTEKPGTNEVEDREVVGETEIKELKEPEDKKVDELESKKEKDPEIKEVEESPVKAVKPEVKDIAEPEVKEVVKQEEAVFREMEVVEKKEEPEFKEMEVTETTQAEVKENEELEPKNNEEHEAKEIPEVENVEKPEVKEVKEPEVKEVKEPEVKEVKEQEVKEVKEPEVKEVKEPEVKEVKEPEVKEVPEPEVKEVKESEVVKVPEVEEVKEAEVKNVEEAVFRKKEEDTKKLDPEFREVQVLEQTNMKEVEEPSTMSTSEEDYSAESLESTRTKALPFLDIFSYTSEIRMSPEKREELEKLRRIILHLYFNTKKQADDYYKIGVVALKWFDTVSESPTTEEKITFLKYWLENNNLDDEELYDKLILLIKNPSKLTKEYKDVIHEQVLEINNEESGDIDEDDVFRVGVIILKLQNVLNDNKYNYMDMIRRIIQKPVADYTERDKEIINRLLLLANSPTKLDKTFNKIRYEILKQNLQLNQQKMNIEQVEHEADDGSKLIVAIMRVPPKAYRKNKAIGSKETREKIIQKLLDDLHRKMNSTSTETEDDSNESKGEDNLLLKKIIIMDENSKDGKEARRTFAHDDHEQVHALVKSLVKDELGTNSKKPITHQDVETVDPKEKQRMNEGDSSTNLIITTTENVHEQFTKSSTNAINNVVDVESTKFYRTYFDTIAQTYVPGTSEELPRVTDHSPFIRELENGRENNHPMDSEIERTTILNFGENSDYTSHDYIITELPSTIPSSLEENTQDHKSLVPSQTIKSPLRRFLDIILHKSVIKEGPSKTYVENNQKTVVAQNLGNTTETREQEESSIHELEQRRGTRVYQEIEAADATLDPDFQDMTTKTPFLRQLLYKIVEPLKFLKSRRRNLDPNDDEITYTSTEINNIVQEQLTTSSVENKVSSTQINGIRNETSSNKTESSVAINISEKALEQKTGADNITTIPVIKATDPNKAGKNCKDENGTGEKSSTTESNNMSEFSTTTKDHKQNAKSKGHSSDCNNKSKHNTGHVDGKSNEEEFDFKAFERLRKALRKAEQSLAKNGTNINETISHGNSKMKNEPLQSDVEKFWAILRYFMEPETKFNEISER